MKKPPLTNPKEGAIRFNTDNTLLEIYHGGKWSSLSYWSPEKETNGTRGLYAGGTSSDVIDYYQYLDLPFVSDRFWFLRGQFETKNGVFTFRWEKLDNGGPHKHIYEKVNITNVWPLSSFYS